jgi:flavin reductase (DIM6/NTAB) family NADH-FMN oxidoreductase RutF
MHHNSSSSSRTLPRRFSTAPQQKLSFTPKRKIDNGPKLDASPIRPRTVPTNLKVDDDPDHVVNKWIGQGRLGVPEDFEDLETFLDDRVTASKGLRTIMRDMPHSVVVVTACRERPGPLEPVANLDTIANTPSLSPFYDDFCGVTISSMTSVTLGPPAIVSFNLQTPSRTLSGILQNKVFRIHLLEANPAGADVANAFIQQKHSESFRHLAKKGRWVGLSKKSASDRLAPLIDGPGVRGHLVCEVMPEKCIQVGDHMVVIASVEDIDPKFYTRDDILHTPRPALMYSDQKYKEHGKEIKLPTNRSDHGGHLSGSPLRRQHQDLDLMDAYRYHSSGDQEEKLPFFTKLAFWNRRTLHHLGPGYRQACDSIRKETAQYSYQRRQCLTAVMLAELVSRIRHEPELRHTEVTIDPEILQAAKNLQNFAEKKSWENMGSTFDGESLDSTVRKVNSRVPEHPKMDFGEKDELENDTSQGEKGQEKKPWWYI